MSRLLVTCKARSKQTGLRCGRAPVPFTLEAGSPLCHIHGGWGPAMVAQADAAFDRYLRMGPDLWEPPWLSRQRIRAKFRSDARRAARVEKKRQNLLASEAKAGAPIRYEGFEDHDWNEVW